MYVRSFLQILSIYRTRFFVSINTLIRTLHVIYYVNDGMLPGSIDSQFDVTISE